VVAFTNPDTAHYEIVSELCIELEPVGVPEEPIARVLSLAPAPNPSRGLVALHFALPASGEASLKLFDLSGRMVRKLQQGWLPAGNHVRVWDGHTDHGGAAAPGVYFSKLTAGGRSIIRKVVRLN